jgi:hypothetical protein
VKKKEDKNEEDKKKRKKEGFGAKPFGRQAGCLFLKLVFTFPGFDPIPIK